MIDKKSLIVLAIGAAAAVGYMMWRGRAQSVALNRNEAAGPRLPSLPKLPPLPAVSGAAPNMPAMPKMPEMPRMWQ